MLKNVGISAFETNEAAILAPSSSHGGDFFVLHRRAGRSCLARHASGSTFLVYVLNTYITLKFMFYK